MKNEIRTPATSEHLEDRNIAKFCKYGKSQTPKVSKRLTFWEQDVKSRNPNFCKFEIVTSEIWKVQQLYNPMISNIFLFSLKCLKPVPSKNISGTSRISGKSEKQGNQTI